MHELENTLAECLKGNNFTNQEKIAAYKLLALTYIYLEEPEKADDAMLTILRTDHEFKVNEAADPAEFVALYKTFRTHPIYSIGGNAGVISSQPNVISSNYVNDGSNEYASGLGFLVSVAAEIPINSKFILNPELSFQSRSFNSSNVYNARTTTGIENQNWLSLPVLVQYKFYENQNKTLSLYGTSGFCAEYLLTANKTLESQIENNSPVKETSESVLEQRNKFNTSFLLGGGVKRKISSGYLVVEVRYQLGLSKVSPKDFTFENNNQLFSYNDVDAVYSLNSLSLSVGYLINIYNPIKLTK